MPSPNTIYGFLGSFPKGVNSDIDPLLLPEGQLSYAINATMRGDFVRCRPNFFNIALNDTTSGAFQSGLFQGTCYYRTSGDGTIMMAVNGQLFQITIDQDTATVTQINLPDAGGSTTTTVQWLWQAEQWCIWNDGINLPMFIKGTNAVRSEGPASLSGALTSLGSLAGPLTIPDVGQSVIIPTATDMTPYVGQAVLIDGMQFTLTQTSDSTVSGTNILVTDVIQSTSGDELGTIPGSNAQGWWGTPLQTNNAYIGTISSVTQFGNSITDWGSISNSATTNVWIVSASLNGSSISTWPTNQTTTYVCSGTVKYTTGYSFPVGASVTLYGAGSGTGVTLGGTITSYSSGAFSFTIQSVSRWIQGGLTIGTTGALSLNQPGSTMDPLVANAVCVPSVPTQTQLSAIPQFQLTLSSNCTAANGATLSVGGISFEVVSGSGTTTITCQMVSSAQGQSIPMGSGSPITGLSTTSGSTFTVALNESLNSFNSGTTYSFQAFIASGATISFTGQWGGTSNPSTLINCQMATIPAAGSTILTVSGSPSSLNQFVKCVSYSAVITTVAYVYNASVSGGSTTYSNLAVPTSGSLNIPVPSQYNVANGTLLFAPAVTGSGSGTVLDGNTDAFLVTGSTANQSSTGYYAIFENQTGTAKTVIASGTQIFSLPQLPVGTIGAYGRGRNWMALPDGVSYVAGDLVGSSSGTLANNYADAVLYVSQNMYLANGATFKIPGSGESIAAMQFVASLDVSLGQGPLQVFTNDTVFSCDTPTDASTWSSVTNPILTESLIGSGGVGDDAVTQSNADLLFRRPDGGVQSLLLARLDYNQWGNTPISREVSRLLSKDDPTLLKYCSMQVFNNRLLMTCNAANAPRGVYHSSLAVLNFDSITSLQGKNPSIWEGQWTGLNVLKIVQGMFDGVQRCFAISLSQDLNSIEIHEVLLDNEATVDDANTQVTWTIESGAINWKNENSEHLYRRLIDGEIYLDKITPSGVTVNAFYKPDQNSVWTPWYNTVIGYQDSDSGFRPRVSLGEPDPTVMDVVNDRPMREGYDFQVKFQFTGYCRFLGGRFAILIIPQPEFGTPS